MKKVQSTNQKQVSPWTRLKINCCRRQEPRSVYAGFSICCPSWLLFHGIFSLRLTSAPPRRLQSTACGCVRGKETRHLPSAWWEAGAEFLLLITAGVGVVLGACEAVPGRQDAGAPNCPSGWWNSSTSGWQELPEMEQTFGLREGAGSR